MNGQGGGGRDQISIASAKKKAKEGACKNARSATKILQPNHSTAHSVQQGELRVLGRRIGQGK
jgi:hypothetical protein